MIKLYTNHCRKCEILTAKLKEKNVDFEVEDNETVLVSLGFDFMPVLEVDGDRLDYGNAIKYVNSL
jgi:hypothetical protein